MAGAAHLDSRENDIAIKRLASALFAALPAGTQVIPGGASEVGVLRGDGAHCDISVTVRVSWSGSLAELKDRFADARLAHAFPKNAPVRAPSIGVRPEVTAGQFAIEAIDGPYPAGLDWRCRRSAPIRGAT